MDILKKMFQSDFEKQQKENDASASSASNKDEFRKPQWFEEAETDDELFDDDRKFAFQVFTSPLEMQKHFERQLQRMLEAVQQNEDIGLERDVKEDFLKPGFESKILKEFQKRGNLLDTDLDGEIFPDELHTLIQRLNPEEVQENILPANKSGLRKSSTRAKLSDEEIIMGRIHGTLSADGEITSGALSSKRSPSRGKPDIMTPMTPFSGVFDGSYHGPKMFSQSVMTKTVRKPDGTYETTKVTTDSTGQKTTTVTRIVDGRKETIVKKEGGSNAPGTQYDSGLNAIKSGRDGKASCTSRNIYVTKAGYAMPRNLW